MALLHHLNKLFLSSSLRVWDKVISGSCKILVFVALEILLSYKIMLMGITRPEGVVRFLCNVSKSEESRTKEQQQKCTKQGSCGLN